MNNNICTVQSESSKFASLLFDQIPNRRVVGTNQKAVCLEKLNWDSQQGRDLATSGCKKQKFQFGQSYSYIMRKVGHHQILIQNNLGFMVSDLIYISMPKIQIVCYNLLKIYIVRRPQFFAKSPPKIFPRGAFTYDVRCFLGIFDQPTYPNQILYYISLFSKIRSTLTYLPTWKSDVICKCSLAM